MIGSPRTIAALAVTLACTACAAAPASAQLQLPRLPEVSEVLPDQTVRQVLEPVQDVVDQPLPQPVEDVVNQPPVAPIREQVRDTVRQVTGGTDEVVDDVDDVVDDVEDTVRPGGGGGGGGSTPSASDAGPAASAPAGGSTPQGGGSADGGRGDRGQARGGGSGDDRSGRGSDTAGGAGSVGSASGDDAPGEDASGGVGDAASAEGGDDDRGAILRTVDRIVEVVPAFVWVALGVLALVALALGARAFIERRRAKALEGERERLLHDMGLLERVLLPQVPERLGDLAASVAYRPAAGPAAGGDFYDVFELPDGRVALLVGDVSGHGREALEGTGALRPTLRAELGAGAAPRVAIEVAGRAAGIAADGRFTTVVAAIHDPGAGTLTYATAGHPPPVIVGPGAHDPLIAVSSPPLGVGIRTGMRQTTVPLPRGAAACFFTDGLLEARSGGELLGHEWLTGVVSELGPMGSASEVLDRVVAEADDAPDDMTACLVRAVAGPVAAAPRVEELELDADELASSAPTRFLETCGVPEEAVAGALAEAEAAIASSGRAVLTVTMEASGPSVDVTGRTPEALATT